MNDEELIAKFPPRPPTARLLWTAIVDVADRQDLGPGPRGHRYMVPILGGRFYAGPGIEDFNGSVLSGGADRQVVRADGIKELDALYEMRTDCGSIITVHNKVIVDESRAPGRYAMSVIHASAERGKFDWINRRLITGTLQSARPERQAVIIRAWEADTAPEAQPALP